MSKANSGKTVRTVTALVAGMRDGLRVWADQSVWCAAERRGLIRWNGDSYELVQK